MQSEVGIPTRYVDTLLLSLGIPIQFSPQNARFLNTPPSNCGYPVLQNNKSANAAGVMNSYLGS